MIGSVFHRNGRFGYATLNLCSGNFYVAEYFMYKHFYAEIKRTNPEELLIPDKYLNVASILNRKDIRN
ncbi:MAG: hypothetical protein U0T61_02005 [Buchnera aphidicola (Melaphis rhois)]